MSSFLVSSFFMEVFMNDKLDFLLKYISNNTYYNIINNKSEYLLKLLEDARINVCHNIEYLINYGVGNIDHVVFERLEELTVSNKEFRDYIDSYEKILPKDKIIIMFENI